MKFRVDPWSVEYGASVESELTASTVEVNPDIEVASEHWAEIGPNAAAREPETVLFVDGVRRVDARVWIEGPDGDAQPGICASFGAGVARCGAGLRAEVMHPSIGRGVFSASPHAAEIITRHGTYSAHVAGGPNPEALWLALQERMARREVAAAEAAREECPDPANALVVVDGPLTGRQHVPGAIGVIKTHGVAYLPPDLHRMVGQLRAGSRTPLFAIAGRFSRLSWYLRLPGGADAPWAGVVRVECSTEVSVPDACALADAGRGHAGSLRQRALQGPPGPPEPLPDRGLGAGAPPPSGRPRTALPGTPSGRGRRPQLSEGASLPEIRVDTSQEDGRWSRTSKRRGT